ncbi:hypothetical protein JG687_00001023 [Phytophthora cactorum]|uniref:Uncharacterized protein n=2 Tax=Phytophthora cactorum TaxID=29920 RepID=A0A8T1V243_9STRA|nr:hypothetical protein JG687_00001023 [Phytophthora cactorum]
MADTPILSSYSRQFALRQPPKSKKPDNFNNKKPVKRPASWKLKHDAASSSQKASMQSRKTLVDAFKQHGMRLCDGARLNAVGKGIHALGRVPPTVSASITALYLSQNNLLSLEGIDQFSAVRLLSVGGNLISSDKEVARLNELAQLRNLNLMGNPLCDQPNYRLRIIALLTKLQYEDALSEQEQEALKVQMLTIIVRTHAKLAENPKVKAKEYLLKLANGSSPRAHRQDGPSSDIRQRCASWEEAYANVIALQQKTIANLHAICEKNRKEMAAKDTAVSLSDQIEILHERSKGDNQQVVDLEQALRRCEKINLSLENELKKAKAAIEEERRAWEDALCDEEEKREKDSVKYRSLAQENQVQQVRMIELKRELEAEKAKVTGVEKVNEDLRTASENIANTHHAEVAAAMDKQRELEREIAELRRHLKEQETEREDTANRLQEYEKRIASTCEAMNEHEQAHERENERLRNECTSIEAKWKEEQVKNAELSRLLQRKNQLILNMTHRINHVEPTSFDNRQAIYQTSQLSTPPMRVGFVFALVVVTLIACFNGLASAEGAVVANNQRLDSINGLISRDITRRNLRATATTNGEERGWATSFTEKIGNLFKSNPGLSQKVETLQKNPTLVKNLEKATFTQKGSSKVRAWFMNMYNNSSKRDKFFILATLIMFPIGVWAVYTNYRR